MRMFKIARCQKIEKATTEVNFELQLDQDDGRNLIPKDIKMYMALTRKIPLKKREKCQGSSPKERHIK